MSRVYRTVVRHSPGTCLPVSDPESSEARVKNGQDGAMRAMKSGLAAVTSVALAVGLMAVSQSGLAGTCDNASSPYDVPAQSGTVDLDADCAGEGGFVHVLGNVDGGGSTAIVDGAGNEEDWYVQVFLGHSVTNNASGYPTISFRSPWGVVENEGAIQNAGNGPAIYFHDAPSGNAGYGWVINRTGGEILSGGSVAIQLDAGATIDNEENALIRSTNGSAVNAAGALLVNNAGTIETQGSSGNNAIGSSDGGQVVNSGTILGRLNFFGSGTVSINNSGWISGLADQAAIRIIGVGATVSNSGAIHAGLNGTAISFGGGDQILELQSGSWILGNVAGGTGADSLLLGGSGVHGFDLDRIGTQFFGFEHIEQIDGDWEIEGSMTEDFALSGGIMTLDSGTVSVDSFTQSGGQVENGTLSASGYLLTGGDFDATIGTAGPVSVDTGATVLGSNALLNDGGALTIYAGGTLDLGGTSQATGSFYLANGALSNGTLNASSLTLEHGTIAADLTGAASLVKSGAGTVIIDGLNDYTGGTTIMNGTLMGTTNSFQGQIVNDGTMVFFQTGLSGTYAGDISGSGFVSINGGFVNLTGTNSYTGGTALGSSSILNGDTDSVQGNIAFTGKNSELGFIQAVDGTFAGTLSGGTTSLVFKEGSGVLTLSGDSAGFSGSTFVTEGALLVNGRLGGSLLVESGADLGGTGAISDTVIAGGAELSPGDSIGLLTIHGDLSFGSTSMLDFEFTEPGSASDWVHVGGNLVLDGVLHVSDLGGFGAGDYTLMEYDGTLTDNTLEIASLPPGFNADIDTSTAGEIVLVVEALDGGIFADRFELTER